MITHLIDQGVKVLGCSPSDVTRLSEAVGSAVPGNRTQLSNTALALQIIASGGVEAHLQTMLPDSEWALVIYPNLKRILDGTASKEEAKNASVE